MPQRARMEPARERRAGPHAPPGEGRHGPPRRLKRRSLPTEFLGPCAGRGPSVLWGGAVLRGRCSRYLLGMGKVTRLNGEDGPQRLHLREIPGEEARPRESVGQDLRSARLRRGDELSQVSHALRINKTYLEALESDCPDKLPGRTYAIGFVR